jgi:iron complex transport system permease protein
MRNSLKLLLAACFVVVVFLASMICGRYPIGLKDILTFLSANHSDLRFQEPAVNVLYHIRLPRIFLAMLVGASLSMAGTLFQGMFRNPLVSPDILGVTSGCCFGAALGILYPGSSPLFHSVAGFLIRYSGCDSYIYYSLT